jgi:hypothetical protein
VAARKARADFVKTSTGFSTGSATARTTWRLMAQAVERKLGVKAAEDPVGRGRAEAHRRGATRIRPRWA